MKRKVKTKYPKVLLNVTIKIQQLGPEEFYGTFGPFPTGGTIFCRGKTATEVSRQMLQSLPKASEFARGLR
jgi:hypothetical protein